jgi:DNA transformation protein
MSASPELIEFYADQLAPLGGVETRKMFSGAGYSLGGVTFALLLQDGLRMRVDDETRPSYEAAGCEPFTYTARGKQVVVRRYFSLPDDAADNQERLLELAIEALAAAKRDPTR